MQNPFENHGFSMASLTAAINLLPNRYGRLEQLNLFPAKPVRTRQIIVEEFAGRLNLLPTRAPGSPGTVGERGQRKLRSFVIPHIPHDDVVLPEEVQGLRAFGSETEMEAIGGVMARHLETMRNKHAITLEHLRMGALKGEILDADGSTLVDLFDEFDITAQSVPFEFSTATDNGQLKGACLELLGLMEDGLAGEFSTGLHVLCSPEFFRALTTHKEVKTAYQNWQQGAVLINDMRSGFSYSGITFEEYRGQASFVQADGTLGTRRFIAAGEAHAFPIGTVDTFATYFAPADFNETVNTLGQPLYAKQEPRKFDRGTDLHTQAVSLSGASSEAAAGALMQLGQAFASGQLRGEEFNSVVEQTPRLAQAIADGMGVPLGSLRALAQEGKITSAAVLDALLNQRERLTEEYASLPDTVAGAFTRLRNAFQRAFGERDASSGLTAGLAQAIQLVAKHLELLINLAGVVLVAAFGRMAGAFATSIAAARAEAAARLANLDEGRFSSMSEIAAAEGIDLGQASKMSRLAQLAPDLIEAIAVGRLEVGVSKLLRGRLSASWLAQREALMSANR